MSEILGKPYTQVIKTFREKTERMYDSSQLCGMSPSEVEQTAYAFAKRIIDEYDLDIKIIDVILTGSRCRGLEREDSDIDVVLYYIGILKEYALYDIFEEENLTLFGFKLDINPILPYKSGPLDYYLLGVEEYLEEKRQEMIRAGVLSKGAIDVNEIHEIQ